MKKLERDTTLRSQTMAEWQERDTIINDAAVGSVFVLKTGSYGPPLPALLIYKSEPEAPRPRSITPAMAPKNITIIFYHDGGLKEFHLTTEARLTYLVKYPSEI